MVSPTGGEAPTGYTTAVGLELVFLSAVAEGFIGDSDTNDRWNAVAGVSPTGGEAPTGYTTAVGIKLVLLSAMAEGIVGDSDTNDRRNPVR